MSKLTVIFPGLSYKVKQPLLRYPNKFVEQLGYEVIAIPDIGLPDLSLNDSGEMLATLRKSLLVTDAALREVRFEEYEDILFISKDLGALAAAFYAFSKKLSVRHIMFVPPEPVFQFINDASTLMFTGTRVKWGSWEKILKTCWNKGIPCILFKGADHNLETDSVAEDIRNLEVILFHIESFVQNPRKEFYDIKVLDAKEKLVSMSEYRGKVLLIVNTATGCGFTPQYTALQDLYEKYKDKGFEILDFPCNQFLGQAPGTNQEIHQFCTSRYNTTFPRFAKIDVNGEHESELFRYLKECKGFQGFDMEAKDSAYLRKNVAQVDPKFENNSDIKWNFTKFLVDRSGEVIARYETTDRFALIEDRLKGLL